MAKKKNPVVIGLDIGSHSVKCVRMLRSKDKKKLTLTQVAVHPVGDQTTENLTLLLKPCVELLKEAPDHVRFVFSGSSALVRCVAMPMMSQAELKSAIRFEAENHIAFPIDDCILDFHIVRQLPEKKQMNVLIVAAKRDFIQERLKMLFDMEIRPEIIDIDTFSLVNAYEALSGEAEEKTLGLLNIGHRITSFAIVHDKLPLFVRELPMGGASISKALADAKGITEEEAEKMKVAQAAEQAEDLKAAAKTGLEPLIEEIKQSISFYENESGETFKKIWISGGGALALGALEILNEGLGKEAAFWGNTKKIEFGSPADKETAEKNSVLLNVAYGIAIRN